MGLFSEFPVKFSMGPKKKTPAKPKEEEAPKPVKVKETADKAKQKALSAKKNVLRGVHGHRLKKKRTTVHFRRPKTLKLPRNPKYPRKSTPKRPYLDQFKIVKYPLTTESAMKKLKIITHLYLSWIKEL